MMGYSYFPPTRLQMQIELVANDTAFIYNIALIKKWMDSSFDLLLVDFRHADALGGRMRLQLSILFP